METKICKRCGRELPLTAYHQSTSGRRKPVCVQCYSRKHQIPKTYELPLFPTQKMNCSKCGRLLSIELFEKRYDGKRNGQRRRTCRECRRVAKEKARKKLPKQWSEYSKKRGEKHRKENKQKAFNLMGAKCYICGLKDDCLSIYDFHHLNPDNKACEINTLWARKWPKVEKELAKCVMLCANCHRKVHADPSYLILKPQIAKAQ